MSRKAKDIKPTSEVSAQDFLDKLAEARHTQGSLARLAVLLTIDAKVLVRDNLMRTWIRTKRPSRASIDKFWEPLNRLADKPVEMEKLKG